MTNDKFEEYFQQYKNLIIRIAMNKIGDYQSAQEICQQVFVAFYSHRDHVDDDMVKAWLVRCTQNAAVDYLRKNRYRYEISLEVGICEEGNLLTEESVELYEERQNNRELVNKILKEVKRVNEKWFEVLFLNCVEGLSYAEVAERLHISESVLRARMHRARAYIKEKFGDEYKNRT